MAELAHSNGRTLQLERGGTVLVEYSPPDPPHKVDYPNERAALAVFRKRITQLVHEGWHLKQPDSDIGAAVASDPAIEATVPDDPDQLAVYADWLIERGDPCGELAALRVRDDRALRSSDAGLRRSIDALEATRGYELFGVLADLLRAEPDHAATVRPIWARGWIDGFELDEVSLGTLVAFALHAPMARFARRLVVRHTVDAHAIAYSLARTPRRTAIRCLDLAETDDAQALLDALPELDELLLPAGANTPDGHPRVRAATVRVGRARPYLMIGRWSALETLTVRSTTRPEILGALLATLPLQRFAAHLRELRIDGDVDAALLVKLADELPSSFRIAT